MPGTPHQLVIPLEREEGLRRAQVSSAVCVKQMPLSGPRTAPHLVAPTPVSSHSDVVPQKFCCDDTP